jgi:hypothetical protein
VCTRVWREKNIVFPTADASHARQPRAGEREGRRSAESATTTFPPAAASTSPRQINLYRHRLELLRRRLELLRSRLTSDAAGSSCGAAKKKDRPPAIAAWRRELPGDGDGSRTWSSASLSSAGVPACPACRRPRSPPPRSSPPVANARLRSRKGRLRPPTCSSRRLRRVGSLPPSVPCGHKCIRGERDCKFTSPLSSKAICLSCLLGLLEHLHLVNRSTWIGENAFDMSVGLSLSHTCNQNSNSLSFTNNVINNYLVYGLNLK